MSRQHFRIRAELEHHMARPLRADCGPGAMPDLPPACHVVSSRIREVRKSSSTTLLQHEAPVQQTNSASYYGPYLSVISIDLDAAPPAVDVFIDRCQQSRKLPPAAAHETLGGREPVWDLEVALLSAAQAADLIVLTALLEHFDGDPWTARALIEQAVSQVLQASAYATRGKLITTLLDRLNKAIDHANGGPNVCSATAITLTEADAADLNAHGYWKAHRAYRGYGGHYRLDLELLKSQSVDRHYRPQPNPAFACAAA